MLIMQVFMWNHKKNISTLPKGMMNWATQS